METDYRASGDDFRLLSGDRLALARRGTLAWLTPIRRIVPAAAGSTLPESPSQAMKDDPAPGSESTKDATPEAETSPPAAADEPTALRTVTTSQIGRVRDLAAILFRNFLFSIVTLFVYRFWARTRMRRYIWSSILINDEPVEYAGLPLELLRGFLVTMIIIVVPVAVANFALQLWLTVRGDVYYLLYLPVLLGLTFLIGVGIYSARRYRLSRTQWRGIRFGQTGSAVTYGSRFVLLSLVTLLSLGLCYPLQNVVLSRYDIQNTWFGDRKFEFNGSAWTAFRAFAPLYLINIGIIASIFVLAYSINDQIGASPEAAATLDGDNARLVTTFLVLIISYPFVLWFSLSLYQTVLWRFLFASSSYSGLTFRLRISVVGVMWLKLTNLLIRILTLNFGAPLTLLRKSRYAFNRLEIDGTLDIERIGQNHLKRLRAGEGLADAFDLGSI